MDSRRKITCQEGGNSTNAGGHTVPNGDIHFMDKNTNEMLQKEVDSVHVLDLASVIGENESRNTNQLTVTGNVNVAVGAHNAVAINSDKDIMSQSTVPIHKNVKVAQQTVSVEQNKNMDVKSKTTYQVKGKCTYAGGHTLTNADIKHCIDENTTEILPNEVDFIPVWDSKNLKRNKIRQAEEVQVFKAWKSQNVAAFGFIPLSPLLGAPQWNEKDTVKCPLEAHKRVLNSGCYNFQKERILLPTQLNTKAWENKLKDYWDWQLVPFIKFGFPLDVKPGAKFKCDYSNHKSATLFPEHVAAYLKEERQFNAIYGPFKNQPFINMQCSPLITRPKPDSDKRRVIVDLSWPHGASVNDAVESDEYLGTQFMLTFPSIDDITTQVTRLGRGCHLYKVDISRAFRHINMDPTDYNKLGLTWDGFYFDSCLPFGFKHGSKIFQRVGDAIRYIMARSNHHIINYIDDLIGFGLPSSIQESYGYLCSLLTELGLTINEKKLVSPSTVVTCLGVQIDTTKGTISVPPEKLNKIIEMCLAWSYKTTVTKRQLQSLLGSLLHITKCVRTARVFLNRMLQTLRNAKDLTNIKLDDQFYRDLNWFQTFLPHFNGVCLYHHPPLKNIIQIDASLQGLGGRWGDLVYKLSIPLGMDGLGIVQLEMLNIYLALRVWAPQWKGKNVKIECDNQAVVSVIKQGKTRDIVLAAYARNISMLSSLFDIELTLIHLPGVANTVADLLSRWDTTPQNHEKLKQLIQKPQWVHVTLDMLRIDWTI